MSFETITTSPIDEFKKEHIQLAKKYLQLKNEMKKLIKSNDDETITNTATELRKAYCEMQCMFWKIKEEEIKIKLEDFDSKSVEYWELCIQRFQYYDKSMYYHYMVHNQEYTYNRCIKPVVANKISGFHDCILSKKRMQRISGEE